ncbi:peptide ABC transporter substrate-binding protein [Lachnobacterium bovis]|uniref:Oligopeptide transport system substrate-binding protein n=1 Tax=Lachnobacterium bovis TaxID=140626 RepID=A0A1H9U1J7_9FIRM|nr:peptide ABC transporter substrate-binding protein [Lachnobacterium bovis]SES03239.1 oligopeptide transport system substrate-binding protein [Lachnobacterium bovis]
MKKRLVSLLLVASMAFGLCACGSRSSNGGKSSSSAKATKVNTETDTLFVNLASEPAYLDPALNSSVDGGCLAVNSFVGLYTYDKNKKLVPAIATGMPKVSKDQLTYKIKLNKTKWSNGEPLTANDFVYSWNRVINKDTGADYAYLFDVIAKKADGTLDVTADNDYELTIKLASPCPYFNDLLAFPTYLPVYQKGVEAAGGTEPGKWAQNPGFVCNGAYKLEKWKHNESMEYVKNDNFYDAKNVKVSKLSFMLSADPTASYTAYNSGNVDFIDDVPTAEIKTVKNSKEFHCVDQLGTYYACFNVGADLFKDMSPAKAAKFRKAISILIDRQYIVDSVGQTGQKPADSFVPYGMSDGNGKTFKTSKDSYYDLDKTGQQGVEKAKKLLEECGYKFTKKSDGNYKVSPAISLPYLVNEGGGHKQIAECMQQDLARLGIEMTIKSEDWNVFLQDRKDGKFTFAREGWIADFNDPINMLELFSSKSGNNDAQLGKTDAKSAPDWKEYDELIEKVLREKDFAKRAKLLHKAEKMLMDTNAVIPLYFYNDVYMQKTNVSGIYSTVFGMKYFMYATKSAK